MNRQEVVKDGCQSSDATVLKEPQINIKNELILKNEYETTIDISHLLKKDFDADFEIELLPSIEKSENCDDIFVTDIVRTEKFIPYTVNNKRKKRIKDTLQSSDNGEEMFATDITENLNTNISNKRRKRNNDLPDIIRKGNDILDNKEKPRRRVKRLKKDKQGKDEGEKEKESIECEFCHKILTSKLSLRNHYKIHTGFDVVCEVQVFFAIVIEK